jgi:hypothetical protein
MLDRCRHSLGEQGRTVRPSAEAAKQLCELTHVRIRAPCGTCLMSAPPAGPACWAAAAPAQARLGRACEDHA